MSITRHHAEWLSLLEISGPFLSMPVLMKNFPQGLDTVDVEIKRKLKMACEEWLVNRDSRKPDPSLHHAWIKFVLTEALEMPQEILAEGPGMPPGLQVKIPQYGETLRPDLVIINPDDGKARILIEILPAGTFLEKPLPDRRWKASPAGRMLELLHGTGVILGLITNGDQWMLIHAPPDETTSYISWYSSLWQEEPLLLQSFCSLLKARRMFGVTSEETLEGMFSESMQNQHEVTDQLGYQVRRAVEVLVRTFDRIDQDSNRTLLKDIPEKTLYESALSIMMRLVFLFCAEERKMLPLDDPFYNENYAVSTISAMLRETADQQGEEVLERRYDGWCRLLATFRAVHGGISHERLHLPAYGGQLFDPDRYPFLEGRQAGTVWQETPANPLPVDNRTVLHLLEALQYLQMKLPGGGPAEPRRLSFRALDIEQIGHVYEGLLDHTVFKAHEPVLGIAGTKYNEPEITVPVLEEYKKKGDKELIKFLAGETGKSEKSLFNIFKAEITREQYKKLSTFCGNEEDLFDKIFPFEGLIRDDTFGNPIIIPSGSFYVTQGSDRRTTGTHYTPRSLTEPIVKYTLEPLVYDGPSEGKPQEEWQLKSPGEILELKICDMAMGSGAFLVQTCRYLSELLVEAWERAEKKYPEASGITVEGEPVNGKVDIITIPSDPDDRFALSRRLIVDRCLYGVDKNPMAVEMAKLSLWLVTMQKNIPFTFLDHALKCGDSLLGITDLNQIKYFHLEPEKGKEFHRFFDYAEICASALEKAVDKRNMLEKFIVKDIMDFERKKNLNEEADSSLERVKFIGDLIIGAAMATASIKKKDSFEEELYNLGTRLSETFTSGDFIDEENLRKEVFRLINYGNPEKQIPRKPFHWAMEFPEVFENRTGFDAIVGNPPFQGGQKITGILGTDYRDYLVKHLAKDKRGSADICAYFFLRSREISGDNGSFGLLATNTIAQGDTREVGLEQIVQEGSVIYRAVPSRKWPGEANLQVGEIWGRKGDWKGNCFLGEKAVDGITPFLSVPSNVQGKPYRIKANEGKSFQGSIVLGMGFVLTPEEAQALIKKDPRNNEVIFPYLNGEDLNSRPDQSPSRWVINFHDWPLEKAEAYVDCMKILREKVKPEREKLPPKNSWNKSVREKWWLFGAERIGLYSTIKGMEKVLIVARVSKSLAFSFIKTKIITSEQLVIIVEDKFEYFAILQSIFHNIWVHEFASSMRTDLRYTPSDCFETFPFPPNLSFLEAIGELYHIHRQFIMTSRQEGLTKTYNHFHNPSEKSEDIKKLRSLHVEMDYQAAKAYGWEDLELSHGFHETKQGLRYTISEEARREVLDRLLLLNHERYEEEVKQGLHEKGTSKKKTAKKEKKKPDDNMDDLFGFG